MNVRVLCMTCGLTYRMPYGMEKHATAWNVHHQWRHEDEDEDDKPPAVGGEQTVTVAEAEGALEWTRQMARALARMANGAPILDDAVAADYRAYLVEEYAEQGPAGGLCDDVARAAANMFVLKIRMMMRELAEGEDALT